MLFRQGRYGHLVVVWVFLQGYWRSLEEALMLRVVEEEPRVWELVVVEMVPWVEELVQPAQKVWASRMSTAVWRQLQATRVSHESHTGNEKIYRYLSLRSA